MKRSALARAINEFRLSPPSFLLGFRRPPRVSDEDAADIERFVRMFDDIPAAPADAPHLLILSYLPLHYTNKMEMILARSFQDRGWKVSVMTNHSTEAFACAYFGRLPGAQLLSIEDFLDFSDAAGIASFVKKAVVTARSSIPEFKRLAYRGARIPLNAIASLTAARPDGMLEPSERLYRDLGKTLRRSALLINAADSLYRTVRPTLILSQEKGFIGTCESFYAAIELGIDYVQWVSCHEPESVMFKRYRRENLRDHPFSVSDATWRRIRHTPWDERYREEVLGEFERGYKSGEWFKYKRLARDQRFADRGALSRQLGLDPAKKTAVIYSHILNDANLFYGDDLFPGGYEEWLVETVRAAADNPAVNWVLKLHPANVFRNARVGYSGEYGELIALRHAFGRIPEFLKIVRPEEKVSPLSFFGLTDWGITVRGTIGVELPCFGVPVITAGTGRYSGKGFTVDSATVEEYLGRIRSIERIPALTEEQVRLGILHAYVVFRARPARYGAALTDIYPDEKGARQRNLALRAGSLDEVLAHPQIQDITDFLVSKDDDFLDRAVMPVNV
jgi:hypothetical protein